MKCSYCDHESDASLSNCPECGIPLGQEEGPAWPIPTPHRVGHFLIHWIWEHLAVKRSRLYLAGLLIGLVGACYGALFHPQHAGSVVCGIAALGGSGVGAVWFLSFAERLNARVKRNREEGNPVFGTQVLLVLLGLGALVLVAVCVAAVCALFV